MLVIHQGISLTFQTCFVKVILAGSLESLIKQKTKVRNSVYKVRKII